MDNQIINVIIQNDDQKQQLESMLQEKGFTIENMEMYEPNIDMIFKINSQACTASLEAAENIFDNSENAVMSLNKFLKQDYIDNISPSIEFDLDEEILINPGISM